jgi:hypothetical protein
MHPLRGDILAYEYSRISDEIFLYVYIGEMHDETDYDVGLYATGRTITRLLSRMIKYSQSHHSKCVPGHVNTIVHRVQTH